MLPSPVLMASYKICYHLMQNKGGKIQLFASRLEEMHPVASDLNFLIWFCIEDEEKYLQG